MTSSERTRPEIVRGLRTPRAAGVAGLLFSALFVASILLLRHHPPSGASAAELGAFYLHGGGKYVNLVGLYLAPFAGIAFLWFVAVARSQIGHRSDRFFDTVFLGSGVLFVAMVFAAAILSNGRGLFRSTDGGVTWAARSDLDIFTLAYAPSNAQRIYAAGGTLENVFTFTGDPSVIVSRDGGTTFATPVPIPGAQAIWQVAVDPANADKVYAATGGGVFVSTDGGTTWANSSAGLSSTSTSALAIPQATPGTVLVGSSDDGADDRVVT